MAFATAFAAATAVLLAACATPRAPAPVEPAPVSAARVAMAEEDWERAAELWTEAAAMTDEERPRMLLEAAAAWSEAGQPERARTALERASALGVAPADQGLESLLRGELALSDNDIEQADFYLSAAADGLPPSRQPRLRAALDRLQLLRADPSAGALAAADEARAAMDRYDTAGAIAVLRALEAVPSGRLRQEAAGGSTLAPWATLALAVRATLVSGEDLLAAASRWQESQPDHPVDSSSYLELCWQYGQLFRPPGRIAVLLPTQGPLEAAAAAIRDGFASAFLEKPAGSEVSFVAVADDPLSSLAAYRRAADQGFQWVVGPLRQESVQALAKLRQPVLPALMLNWPENARPADGREHPVLFSLALSQQAEAAAVAGKMLELGLDRVLVLRGDSDWAARSESSFIDAFAAGGGEVVGLEQFSAAEADHSAKLTALLQIEASRERRRRLEAVLGAALEFEPSRRDDFEAIFFATGPELGRQLKPQLRFFDAGEKPVFAMSRVYTGRVNRSADRDLDGVVIPATRWTTDRASADVDAELASLRDGALGNLHALGRDAWNLLPWLGLMRRDPEFVFPGSIGDLRVAPDGRLLREPVWARFEGGSPASWTPPKTP